MVSATPHTQTKGQWNVSCKSNYKDQQTVNRVKAFIDYELNSIFEQVITPSQQHRTMDSYQYPVRFHIPKSRLLNRYVHQLESMSSNIPEATNPPTNTPETDNEKELPMLLEKGNELPIKR